MGEHRDTVRWCIVHSGFSSAILAYLLTGGSFGGAASDYSTLALPSRRPCVRCAPDYAAAHAHTLTSFDG